MKDQMQKVFSNLFQPITPVSRKLPPSKIALGLELGLEAIFLGDKCPKTNNASSFTISDIEVALDGLKRKGKIENKQTKKGCFL